MVKKLSELGEQAKRLVLQDRYNSSADEIRQANVPVDAAKAEVARELTGALRDLGHTDSENAPAPR